MTKNLRLGQYTNSKAVEGVTDKMPEVSDIRDLTCKADLDFYQNGLY